MVVNMLNLCISSCNERLHYLLTCIDSANKYKQFDRIILIINETEFDKLTKINEKKLLQRNCEIYKRHWNDDMPAMRNAYLDKTQNGDWIVVADDDEHFCDVFALEIKSIIKWANKQNKNLLLINSHDSTIQENGKVVTNKSTFYKNLIFKKYQNTKYQGVGNEQKVHEVLRLGVKTNIAQLNDKYYYTHVKYYWEIWERATRNVFIGGGGNNVGKTNIEWVKLRLICDKLDILTWHQFRNYLKQGKITKDLKKWIIKNRTLGFDYENEMTDIFRYYFIYLHPEENKAGLKVKKMKDQKAIAMKNVEDIFLEILGRHADTKGKIIYTNMILNNQITYDLLRKTLMKSAEYKQKHPETVEVLHLENVGVDIDLKLTDDIIYNNIIKRSRLFRDKYLKYVYFGKKWDAMLEISKKVETLGEGTDFSEKSNFTELIEIFKSYAPPEGHTFILNPGAGAGVETNLLLKEGYNVIGITFGKENIGFAKKEFDIDLYEMDMHNLEFPPKIFDGVFSVQTFEHTFSPWLHILEIRRVLRDGGIVLINIPNPDDYDILDIIWHTSPLYPNQVISLFKKAGFELFSNASKFNFSEFTMVFKKLPDGKFPTWGYLQHIMNKLKEVN